MIHVTAEQLAARLLTRPPGYLQEIEPAILRRHPDGSLDFDDHHPAWAAAVAKYRDVAAAHLTVCRVCDEFNGNICEAAFPKGCCSCTWATFLRGGRCPIGLF